MQSRQNANGKFLVLKKYIHACIYKEKIKITRKGNYMDKYKRFLHTYVNI